MGTVKDELAKKAGNIKGKQPVQEQGFSTESGIDGGRKCMIRLLRADEIECRVGTVSEKGLSILLLRDHNHIYRIISFCNVDHALF